MDWTDATVQLRVLEARSRQASIRLRARMQMGIPWKDLNMDCVSVSRAHVEVFVFRAFLDKISSLQDHGLSAYLTKLRNLVVSLCSKLTISLRSAFLTKPPASF